ncbi:sensor histidine kinase [Sphingorhabdus contaminans]|uniref:Sensor histidine kinase n=1 Tax=Sphingorhabdus contaminans TaxID=1343899 RepID=A0A553WL60_9SPHN|nr:histidine kinase [Sphingorhabdus contaminans]TSB05447.1 sensor histidine kinase [Sphingorhabdus contaminans]
MAVLELSDQPFFSNKNRAFWNLHSAGWGGATALYAVTVIANGQPLSFLVPVLISAVTGYSITLILSVVYRYVIEKQPIVTWGATLLSVVLASLVYAYLDTWVVQTIRGGADDTPFAQLLLGAIFKDGLLVGAWSALYYAINYFVRAEEQADQMMRLEAQATSAQLTMLRYQLNPHFLFNTLNSISTLVLLKQTEQANAMLSRLSSFLRFTLINEAAAKVPLTQEIETLKLYLDIEKMRFEERLRTFFNIEPAVENALVPSLLLQPLVENAIKYAVTPKEEGADISVTAQLVGQRVRITVSDTGPGLQPGQQDHSLSTGVGMANTRERLSQAYGDDQRFEYYVKASGGFEVLLELPYQTRIIPVEDNQAGATLQGMKTA